MSTPRPIKTSHPAGFVVAVVAGTAAHLGVGFFYLLTGLVAPTWAVVVLILWWAVLTAVGARLIRHHSPLGLLVPLVAAASWFAAITLGSRYLGWVA